MSQNILDDLPVLISDALDDLVMRPVLLTRKVAGTYDPKTGHTTDEDVVQYEGLGLVTDYSDYSRAMGAVEVGDRKLLILQHNFGAEPELGDTIETENVVYNVIRADQDPAHAVWQVQVRV